MIFLRIISSSEEKIEHIAHLLLQEKLVIDINIKRHVDRVTLVNNQLCFTRVYLLTAKTKGLLFGAIDQLLKEKYSDNMPEVYSLPIVHMDWEQAQQLSEVVKPV